MIQRIEPIDVSEALRAFLARSGIDAAASKVPRDLSARLPLVRIVSEGGMRRDNLGGSGIVQFRMMVGVDAYARSYTEASELANRVVGLIGSLELTTELGVMCYEAHAMSPYENPDPDRPDIPRQSFNATLLIRGVIRN